MNRKIDSFEKIIRETNRQYHLWSPADKILVACSGGPDSMALLHALYTICGPHHLGVLTVDHKLRLESQQELEGVRAYAQSLDISFYGITRDVDSLAKNYHKSLEDMGRQVRYEALQEYARKEGYTLIAVGHHRGDQAETIIGHMIRGSGVRGLQGMLYKRPTMNGVPLIRPLLNLRKTEILTYVEAQGIPYYNDPSNEEDHYTRNQIRHQVLPVLEKINPQIDRALNRMALSMQEITLYLDQEARKAYNFCRQVVSVDEGPILVLDAKFLQTLSPALRPILWQLAWQDVYDMGQVYLNSSNLSNAQIDSLENRHIVTLESTHIDALEDILRALGPKSFTFKKMKVKSQYGKILVGLTLLVDAYEAKSDSPHQAYIEKVEIVTSLPHTVEEGVYYIPSNWVTEDICLRTRYPGDRIILVDKAGLRIGSKKVKDYLIDRKIPVHQRDTLQFIGIGKNHLLAYKPHKGLVMHDSLAEFYYAVYIKEEL